MNILIFGATGFIGNSIFHSLVTSHNVTIAGRTTIDGYTSWKSVDFLKQNDWNAILEDIELVVNAIGIIQGNFQKVQTEAPIQLYTQCIEKGIKVVHISAIGAEKKDPPTTFLLSKKVTDTFLLQYDKAKIIYPSMVIGNLGKSSQFFAEIAQFPIIPLFQSRPLPFVHITQLSALIKNIVDDFDTYPRQVFAVAQPESLENLLSALKGKKGRFIHVPISIFKFLFRLFPNASIGVFNRETLQMLELTNVDDYKPMFDAASNHVNPNKIIKSDVFPQLFALLSISFIWVWSGISSLISWDTSLNLMKELGTSHQMAALFTCLGSITDIVLGLAVFNSKYRKKIIVLQIGIMMIYMLILSIFSPHYWLHPFGVLSKNIPLMALSYYLYQRHTPATSQT